uniref:Myb-like domain-containing protein n=2 Tax=Anthurium amnicola TaxID=1678845 RepID=A0A1D1YDW0_9ARAE
MKTSPLTADEKALVAEGLKLFKHEWISVWKLFVPHRDPSLLPRQWRIATGTQKSYRKDETVNEKRRLYDTKRRKLKASMTDWQTLPDYEVDDAGQNVADENMDNEDEAYVHEAFLAEVEPGSCKQNSSELGTSKRHLPSLDISPYNDTHVHANLCAVVDERVRSAQVNTPIHELFNSSKSSGAMQQLCSTTDMPIGASSTISSNWLPLSSMPSTSILVPSTYRMRKKKGAQVVKLAPELPPVNLPPSVRVISQSAFRSYHSTSSSSMVEKSSASILVPRLPHVSNARTARLNTGICETVSYSNGTKDNPGKDLRAHADHLVTEESNSESDIQMHPLLFQISDAERPLYYTKNCRSTASRSFDFFAAAHQRANLKLRQPEQSGSMTESSFPVLQSKETALGKLTIDFHPLLQRTSDANCNPAILRQNKYLSSESEPNQSNNSRFLSLPDSPLVVQQQMNNGQPINLFTGQYEKDNELDLDIHLCSATKKVKTTGGRGVIGAQTIGSCSISKLGAQMEEGWKHDNIPSHGHNSKGVGAAIAASSSICAMENTIRSNCESRTCARASMIDTFGATLSSTVYRHGKDDGGDQSSPEIVMEQEELSDSDEEADNVEFECEEMDDSDGDELDAEQADKN